MSRADEVAIRELENRFNAAWHAGLGDHFAGNYRRARAELAEANRLLPELPDVRRITFENDERLKREPLLPWTQVAIGMLVISAAGWAVLLFRRWQRNRFRIRPAEVMRLLEGPEQLDGIGTPGRRGHVASAVEHHRQLFR